MIYAYQRMIKLWNVPTREEIPAFQRPRIIAHPIATPLPWRRYWASTQRVDSVDLETKLPGYTFRLSA